MSTPTPRPALRKSADAHIHPAAPSHGRTSLRPADEHPESAPEPDASAEGTDTHAATEGSGQAGGKGGSAKGTPAKAGKGTKPAHRLSGPLRGTTSDSLRAAAGSGRPARASEKLVDLGVKVPKSVRKDFRAAVKADKKDPDTVVTALLRAWLDG